MTQYRSIEIDFDVNKTIEAERRSFADSPNAALRRLLKLGDEPQMPSQRNALASAHRAWSADGVALPHGTLVRMRYGQQLIEAEIFNGRWVSEDGSTFDSPSAAASALALTKGGETTSLNGWQYWEAKWPGSAEWVPIKTLRTAPPR